MSRKLHQSLKIQKEKTEQVKLSIYGSLGIPLGGRKIVDVPNRQGYVYVRLRDNQNEVIQAFNNRVSTSYDLPVIVVREGSRYVVQKFNDQRYLNNAQTATAFLPQHGTQHSFPRGGGADITWIYAQQIMPALVYPNAVTGTNVYVGKYPLYTPDGRWVDAGGTGTQAILPYKPTTGSSSLMALVFIDSYTGNPGVLVGSGSYFPAVISGSIYPYLPSPSASQIPIGGVLLTTGTTQITWENLYDVRQWIHSTPTGTVSGGTTIVVGNPAIPVYGNGAFIQTGTALRFDGNVQVSTTGTQVVVNYLTPAIAERFWTSGTAPYSIQAINDVSPSAAGAYAFAVGAGIASGTLSFAEGNQTIAIGASSHAEGANTQAIGSYSHAEGSLSKTYGSYSHAEGLSSTASGTASFAAGETNYAGGRNSAILGGRNGVVSGERSVILGGSGTFGTNNDTVYVPYLNIGFMRNAASVFNLGMDSSGNVVTGTAVSGGDAHDHNGGDGGTIAYTSLSGRPTAETNATDIFRCDAPGGTSAFVGTIATLPGGATLTYNISSGNEGAMVPVSTTQLGKMRLYNTTRGTSALISNCVTGTNTLTLTANVPVGWVVGDTITIASQVVSGGGFDWVDIEITSGITGLTNVFVDLTVISATAGNLIRVHPFETYATSKVFTVPAQAANIQNTIEKIYQINSNIITFTWNGTPSSVVIREGGYLE